MYIDIFFGS